MFVELDVTDWVLVLVEELVDVSVLVELEVIDWVLVLVEELVAVLVPVDVPVLVDVDDAD